MRIIAAAAGVVLLAGCAGPPTLDADSSKLRVVTTTGLLADLVRNVGGDRVEVVSIVPDAADPHAYEPTLRDARNAVYADVAFSNYALMETQAVTRVLDANLHASAPHVSLAEESVKYAAEVIPLVENVNLDAAWLGMRVAGEGVAQGANRASTISVSATGATGPGDLYAYLTGTFGDTDVYIDSSDGFDAADGYQHDTMTLPVDAHTHLSWAFTEPGIYTLDISAKLHVDDESRPVVVGRDTFTFAVGVDPATAGIDSPTVIDSGHADLTVDLDAGGLAILYEHDSSGEQQGHADSSHEHHHHAVSAGRAVIHVPAKVLDEVPQGSQYSFLGTPGEPIYQLPQAVLGKNIHGEIDPHLWHSVHNVMAYVNLIRDTLVTADPDGARDYRERATAYLGELDDADNYVRQTIAAIPEQFRHLVTTYDAFGYLAHQYDIDIAGFVASHRATEPSLQDRRKLAATLESLDLPAVFVEPGAASRTSTLTQIAAESGIKACTLYSDTFDADVSTYIALVRYNADSLRHCLGDGKDPS